MANARKMMAEEDEQELKEINDAFKGKIKIK